MVNAHSLLQVNTVPSNKHGNILDLVVTNSDNIITGPNEYPAEFDTDHSILEFILNIDTTVNSDISRTAYNFKRINSTYLTNLNNDTNLCDNVNNACNIGMMEKLDTSETKNMLHGQLLKDIIDIHLGENSNISETNYAKC